QLPRIDEIREEIELVIRRYNYGHQHRAHGFRTPLDMYRQHLPRAGSKAASQLRQGRDILAVLPVETTKVTGAGVVHRGTRFTFERQTPTGPVWVALGTPVTYRADPMLRALFVEDRGVVECLPRIEYWSKGKVPRKVAEQQTTIVTELAARANAARGVADADEIETAAAARRETEARTAAEQAEHERVMAEAADDESSEGASSSTRGAAPSTAPAGAEDFADVVDPYADLFTTGPNGERIRVTKQPAADIDDRPADRRAS
ncbi:MAG TPA: hypothetical protein VE861_15480, partial [Gemmatimonadaceae bacterium]|nr:hypothetical protein [Gemmatimonadaceae bacterium]